MMTTATFKLRVLSWENEDEYGDGGNLTEKDRYFGSLPEILSRLCWPWLDGLVFGVYQRQDDGSWLLYYHSI
jgi:hypothetical protein